jgi:hypothetical protein
VKNIDTPDFSILVSSACRLNGAMLRQSAAMLQTLPKPPAGG